MTPLDEMQALHVQLVAKLITFVYAQGYTLSWGEAYRTPQQAQWDCNAGVGIKNSLHLDRLAVDFMLFKDGVWLQQPSDYKFMGDYWKTLDASARWGGDFKTVDAVHFSLTWQGRS